MLSSLNLQIVARFQLPDGTAVACRVASRCHAGRYGCGLLSVVDVGMAGVADGPEIKQLLLCDPLA